MGTARSRSPTGFKAALFGAPHGTPYRGIDNRIHATAPNAFRAALREDSAWLEHWDFDLGGPLLADGVHKIADLGNLPTKPKDGKGVAELAAEIARHRAYLGKGGRLRAKERARVEREFRALLLDGLAAYTEGKLDKGELDGLVERILKKKIDPYAAAEMVMRRVENDK